MSFKRFKGWITALALFACATAQAADIDLFTGGQPTGSQAPEVLFVIDTGASFSASNSVQRCSITATGTVNVTGAGAYPTLLDKTNGGVEQCALYSVLKSLEAATATVQIGVMLFNSGMKTYDPTTDTFGTECASGIGGCLAVKMVPLTTTVGPKIREWIRQWDISGNTNWLIKAPANRGDGASMQEAWAYFFAKTGVSGRDYSGIAPPTGCGAKHIIYIGNNWNTQASPKDVTNASGSPLARLNGTSPTIASRANPAATANQLKAIQGSPSTVCGIGTLDGTNEGKGAYGLNWALYMKGLGVTTWSVAVMNAGCDLYYGAWLKTLGDKDIGGGAFFSTNNYDELVKALKNVFSNIASVNSVFAAVSLPVSVNTQGSYLNQIYVGMFRPAKNFFPRWNGNLKQYKLAQVDKTLKLQDADSQNAINSLTGFVTECARAFWTPNVADTYWTNDPSGECLTVTGSKASNYPDGNIVEKGAQAYKLRAKDPALRDVRTCDPAFASCTTLTDFTTATAAITQALLNNGGSDRDALISWARGQNLDGELDQPDTTQAPALTAMRASAHGDVVHSRPVPVNYGTDASPNIVVYYGGNDGMFRAVNGNRGSATFVTTGQMTYGAKVFNAGEELWSFMPPEFYGNIKPLRDNTTVIGSPATPANVATQKRYGIDGAITSFQGPVGGVAKTYVYATMRRGGTAIYAFDVTVPANPSLLWKKGCPTEAANDANCSSGYSSVTGRIGQTWSSLKPMFATGVGGGATPLLIMGGGYDVCEDYDGGTGNANNNCGATPNGNKVYVVNAATGAIVKQFDTVRSVIADSSIVRESTGVIKYAYTADMGGNIYRMTFEGDPSAWTIKKIASLGCDTLGTCTANRKFMFQPSVTTLDGVYFILLGSGDREKPVEFYGASKSVTNYFFMVRDKPSDSTWTNDVTNCGAGATVLCKASLYGITTSATPTDAQLNTKPKGWYLGLNPGEQVVTSALTIFGVVTFSTHVPAPTASLNVCKPNLGDTRVYNIGYLNATSANGTDSRSEDVAGDGLPPSPVGGQVTLDDGSVVPFCIGCSKDSPLEGAPPRTLTSVIQPKNRLYWYIQK